MYCTKSTDSTMPKLLSLVINQEKEEQKKNNIIDITRSRKYHITRLHKYKMKTKLQYF